MKINNVLTRAMARTIARRCERIARQVPPSRIIGGTADPYLKRWHLVPRNRLANAYLHEFWRSDDDRALHDHPWVSVSLAISLPMTELTRDRNGVVRADQIQFGDLVFRSARHAHRLVVDRPGGRTLFVTGPVVRQWGFHCPRGWKHWKDFTDYATTGNSAQVGKGCAE